MQQSIKSAASAAVARREVSGNVQRQKVNYQWAVHTVSYRAVFCFVFGGKRLRRGKCGKTLSIASHDSLGAAVAVAWTDPCCRLCRSETETLLHLITEIKRSATRWGVDDGVRS